MFRQWAAGITLTISLAVAGDSGFAPRPSLDDYSIRQNFPSGVVAAAVLSAAEVKRSFAADLSAAYVVVEVAIYPRPGAALALDAYDFALQLGRDRTERPVSPAAVAASLQRDHQNPSIGHDIAVYPTVGVGYSSAGPYGPGGWGTYTGVGVAIGGGANGPPPPQRDPQVDEDELDRKSIPSGQFDVPIAGYLYFPKPGRKLKDQPLVLEYSPGGATPISLPLPSPP